MSLATICQNVAADLGIDDPPLPIVGSRMPTARRLFAQVRRAQWALLRRAQWAATTVEFDFTATGTSDFPLPPDLLRIVNDTVWERSRFWQMRGVLSPQQWQLYKSSIYGRATLWRRWRIRVPGGDGQVGTAPVFSIDPSLAASDFSSKFVFEYQSAWAVRSGATGQMVPDWTGDDDVSILDEFLLELGTRWRMSRRLGLAYDEEKEEYEREVDKAVARDGGTATLQLVPWSRFDDWIGQYTLAAFPPVGPGSGQPPNVPPGGTPLGPVPSLPPDIARLVAPFERPVPPSEDGTEAARAQVLAAWAAAARAPPSAYRPSGDMVAALQGAPVSPPAALAPGTRPLPPAFARAGLVPHDPVAVPGMMPPIGAVTALTEAPMPPAFAGAGAAPARISEALLLRLLQSPPPAFARAGLSHPVGSGMPLRPLAERSDGSPSRPPGALAQAQAEVAAAAQAQLAAAWAAAAATAPPGVAEELLRVIRSGAPLPGAAEPAPAPEGGVRALRRPDGEAAAREQIAAAWAAAAVTAPPGVAEELLRVIRSGAPLPGAAEPATPQGANRPPRKPVSDAEAAAQAQVAAAWAAAAATAPPEPEPPVVVVRIGKPLPGEDPPREWPPGTLGI